MTGRPVLRCWEKNLFSRISIYHVQYLFKKTIIMIILIDSSLIICAVEPCAPGLPEFWAGPGRLRRPHCLPEDLTTSPADCCVHRLWWLLWRNAVCMDPYEVPTCHTRVSLLFCFQKSLVVQFFGLQPEMADITPLRVRSHNRNWNREEKWS